MPSMRDDAQSILDAHDELLHDDAVESQEELRRAGAFIAVFVKAVKAIRFYPADNPLVMSFLRDFTTTCRAFLAEYPIFVLQIGESSFSYDDHVLFLNTDWKSSLPFVLYNDGVRELRFHNGIDDDEIRHLLELISQAPDLNPQEDDLVIMLWEQDFTHIDYLALDELREETASLIPESVDQYRQHIQLARATDSEPLPELPAMEKTEMPAPAFCYDPALYSLTPDEAAQLHDEVTTEIAPTAIFETLDILCEMVLLAREEDGGGTAAGVMLRMQDAMLTLGDFTRAEALLARVYELLAREQELQAHQIIALRQLLVDAAIPARIERIGRMLLRGDHDVLAATHRYLLRLPSEAIPPLIHLLEEARDTYLRRMLCDVLVEMGRQGVQAFLPFLSDSRWYVIRNIVYILGRIGNLVVLPRLTPLLNHVEPRVRQETAQALGHLHDPRSVLALGHALEDPDEVTRSIAAFSLGKIGTPNALAYLLQIMQSHQFRRKSPSEMKAFFDGLGHTRADGAVPVLAQLLRFRALFGRDKADLIRRGAAETLAAIGTPAALAVLQDGCHTGDAATRQFCSAALHASASGEKIHAR